MTAKDTFKVNTWGRVRCTEAKTSEGSPSFFLLQKSVCVMCHFCRQMVFVFACATFQCPISPTNILFSECFSLCDPTLVARVRTGNEECQRKLYQSSLLHSELLLISRWPCYFLAPIPFKCWVILSMMEIADGGWFNTPSLLPPPMVYGYFRSGCFASFNVTGGRCWWPGITKCDVVLNMT